MTGIIALCYSSWHDSIFHAVLLILFFFVFSEQQRSTTTNGRAVAIRKRSGDDIPTPVKIEATNNSTKPKPIQPASQQQQQRHQQHQSNVFKEQRPPAKRTSSLPKAADGPTSTTKGEPPSQQQIMQQQQPRAAGTHKLDKAQSMGSIDITGHHKQQQQQQLLSRNDANETIDTIAAQTPVVKSINYDVPLINDGQGRVAPVLVGKMKTRIPEDAK